MKKATAVLLVLAAIAIGETERWVHRYNGPGNGDDDAYAVICGLDGNVYAAGYSTGSGTGEDIVVISLTQADSERWVYRYNGPGDGDDYANLLICGPDTNIYVVGVSSDSLTGQDFTIISLTRTGTERWVYRYNGPGDSADVGSVLTFGTDGNIYAAGGSSGVGTGPDFTVISLTPGGSERWVYRHNGPGNGSDWALAVACGADSSVYAAGYDFSSGTDQDLAVISLTPGGGERWVYRYNGPGNNWDRASYASLVCGADRNIYVGGVTYGVATGTEFTIISLTPADSERWVYRYDGLGNSWDGVCALTCGADGNLYACGYSIGSGTSNDFTVISLTPADSERWVYCYNGPANGIDFAQSVVQGLDGNVHVAGYSRGSGSLSDIAVASLTPNGSQRWIYRFDGPGHGSDAGWSVAFGPDSSVYVAGGSIGIGTGSDFTVVSLNPALGIEEMPIREARTTNVATLVRGVLFLAGTASRTPHAASLMDIGGRQVMVLRSGANDVSGLAPGVYFVKSVPSAVSREPSAVRKVILTK
jgi:hypothetical protein